jgi:hypothetical protein
MLVVLGVQQIWQIGFCMLLYNHHDLVGVGFLESLSLLLSFLQGEFCSIRNVHGLVVARFNYKFLYLYYVQEDKYNADNQSIRYYSFK